MDNREAIKEQLLNQARALSARLDSMRHERALWGELLGMTGGIPACGEPLPSLKEIAEMEKRVADAWKAYRQFLAETQSE